MKINAALAKSRAQEVTASDDILDAIQNKIFDASGEGEFFIEINLKHDEEFESIKYNEFSVNRAKIQLEDAGFEVTVIADIFSNYPLRVKVTWY